MAKEQVKAQIDIDITNKTSTKSISPLNVGSNMKAVVDLIPDNIVKTIGSISAINGSKTTLQYDINNVIKSGGTEIKLPISVGIGQEVLFLASNYAGIVSVYANDTETVSLSGGTNGISGSQSSLQINANEAYRFISLGNEYWYFEKIIDIPTNYYQLVSERTTDGTLSTNSDFKYPTEKAVKTYVDTNSGGNQSLQNVLQIGNDSNNIPIILIDAAVSNFSSFNPNQSTLAEHSIMFTDTITTTVIDRNKISNTTGLIVNTFNFSDREATGTASYSFPKNKIEGNYILATIDDNIPLTGTTVGSPVSGDIEIGASVWNFLGTKIYNTQFNQEDENTYENSISFSNENGPWLVLSSKNITTNRETILRLSGGGFELISEGLTINNTGGLLSFNSTIPNSRGLISEYNYSLDITDTDYTQKIYVDTKVAEVRPYKVYTALLNQSGTNAPVAIILENTLVGDIIWSYDNIGGYIGTLTGVFANNKTAIMLTASLTGIIINGKVEDINTISIGTMSIVGTYVNNSLVNTAIEIRVYN